MGRRLRAIVEASWGLGDIIEATSVARALDALGYDADFVVNAPGDGGRIAPLFAGVPGIGRVLDSPAEVARGAYDFGVSCLGESALTRRLPPGFCFRTTWRDVLRDGLAAANLAPARLLGFEGPPPPARVAEDAAALDVPPRALVVHAGCNPLYAFKRWRGWPEVCERARARGFHPVIVGTAVDRSATRWEERFDCRFDLPLPRLAALVARAAAYLGNDSGVGHIAAAVGARGVVLFGPTDPRLFGPRGGALVALDAPAREGEGRHPASARVVPIERHDVESVWGVVEGVLAAPPPPPPPATPLPRRSAPPAVEAALPSARDVRATPRALAPLDALFRRVAAAAVGGLLRTAGDAARARAWRAEVARAAGRVHLLAAEVRRRDRTRVGHRRALVHLREAWRAGYGAPAVLRGVAIVLTPRSRPALHTDPMRH